MRIPGTDDVSLPYILACNSHDGSRSFRVLRTAVRVVCSNTLTSALKGGGGLVTAGKLWAAAQSRGARAIVRRRYPKEKGQLEITSSTGLPVRSRDVVARGPVWTGQASGFAYHLTGEQ